LARPALQLWSFLKRINEMHKAADAITYMLE